MKKALFIFVAILSGCASKPPPVAKYPSTDPTSIKIVDTLIVGDEVLGRVSGVACQKSLLADPDYNPAADALLAMKREAARIGATGVARVSYTQAPVRNGCGLYAGRMATGQAYRNAKTR